jgi:hypothetical protein
LHGQTNNLLRIGHRQHRVVGSEKPITIACILRARMPINKKNMRLRVNARITSKVREKDLIAKAEALKENHELILPTCSEKCRACPFIRTRLHLERVVRYKEDPRRLEKLAAKGDKLARAYAATIGLAHEKKAPYLASAKYPRGTAMFALRGKTSREKLIAVQNYDSPQWRVLSVLDLVKKRRLHFYSYGDSFVCTGRVPKPPEDYIRMAAEFVGATKEDERGHHCPHDPESVNHIEYAWVGSEKAVYLCDACAARTKNVLSKLAEGMAVPNVLDSIEISIKRPLNAEPGVAGCDGLLDITVDRSLLEDYSSGKIGDRELIDKHMENVDKDLAEMSRRVFVKGDRCYGENLDAFVAAMTEDPLEAKALKGLLNDVGRPVVAGPGDTVNKLMATYWADYGKKALRAVVSEKLAESYFDDSEEAVRSPMKIIRRAAKKSEHEAVDSKIPRYDGLGTYGIFVDEVVRAYKSGGATAASAILDSESSTDHRTRSIAHAFDLSFGITTRAWRLTEEEKEFGKHLKKFATKLTQSKGPDDHHSAFVTFLREAGVTEEFTRL